MYVIFVERCIKGKICFGGWGPPPIWVRKKSRKTGIFGPKKFILALFGPCYCDNFLRFSVKGGGAPQFR